MWKKIAFSVSKIFREDKLPRANPCNSVNIIFIMIMYPELVCEQTGVVTVSCGINF
jgi:hypothetical protein